MACASTACHSVTAARAGGVCQPVQPLRQPLLAGWIGPVVLLQLVGQVPALEGGYLRPGRLCQPAACMRQAVGEERLQHGIVGPDRLPPALLEGQSDADADVVLAGGGEQLLQAAIGQ